MPNAEIIAIPRVEWADAKRDGDGKPPQYQLQLTLPRKYHNRYTDHTLWDSRRDGKEVLLRITSAESSVPENLPVMILLYAWRRTSHGQLCQYCAGHVTAPIKTLVGPSSATLTMVDANGTSQAKLELRAMSAAGFTLGKPKPRWQPLAFPPPLIKEEMCEGLASNGNIPFQFLRSHIVNVYGRIPVWMSCYLYQFNVGELVTESYLENALANVVRMLGFQDEDEWMQLSHKVPHKFEVLAQVLMFNTACRPYLFDKTWLKGLGLVSTDEFSVIEAAPDVEMAAGDCEDSSESIQRAAEGVRVLKTKSPALRALANMRRGYCSFTIDVTINVGNTKGAFSDKPRNDDPNMVSLHHCVLMMPWCKVIRMLAAGGHHSLVKLMRAVEEIDIDATEGWPTLALEGTESCRGTCAGQTPGQDDFIRECKYVGRNAQDAFRISHVQTTRTEFKEAQFYREVIRLYSPDLYRYASVATLLACYRTRTSRRMAFGVAFDRWVKSDAKSGNIALRVTEIASDADQRTLSELSKRMPILTPLRLDKNPLTRFVRANGDYDAVYTVMFRKMDITEATERAMIGAFGTTGRYVLVNKSELFIANQLTVVFYQFVRDPAVR